VKTRGTTAPPIVSPLRCEHDHVKSGFPGPLMDEVTPPPIFSETQSRTVTILPAWFLFFNDNFMTKPFGRFSHLDPRGVREIFHFYNALNILFFRPEKLPLLRSPPLATAGRPTAPFPPLRKPASIPSASFYRD